MAVTYQTEGVKMPDIKKRETTEWIKTATTDQILPLVKSEIGRASCRERV